MNRAVVFLLFYIMLAVGGNAQPMLPALQCANEKGSVVVSWNCQYDALKSIVVQRSSDKDFHYTDIGTLKNLKKGPQFFTDTAPMSGDNFYKLLITFKSGLKWHSDFGHAIVTGVPQSRPVTKLPAVQNTLPNSAASVPDVKPNAALIKKDSVFVVVKPRPGKMDSVLSVPRSSLSVSYVQPTAKDTGKIPKKKFYLPAANDTDSDPVCIITSKYLQTDASSGNIIIEVNDDVKMHHYSLRFYDRSRTVVVEIPRINAPKVILDKRNFRQRGSYKFVLKKDGGELDSGFVIIR